jgi:hypothetical protein
VYYLKYPCEKLAAHLVRNGFTVDYETWVFRGEKYTMLNYQAMMISFLHIKSNRCII